MKRAIIVYLLGSMVLLLLLGFAGVGVGRAASNYPDRNIELVVPFDPGGITDRMARVLAEHVSKDFGKQVLVVNKPGGGGAVGTSEVLRSNPDGYKLMMNVSGPTTTLLIITPDIPYAWDQLAAIAQISVSPIVFCVKGDSKWASVKEVMDDVRKKPDSFKWSGGSAGSPLVFAAAQLLDNAGIDPNLPIRVVFTGEAPAATALAGGHIDFVCINPASALPLAKADKLKALAVTGASRSTSFPDVPTGAEAGYPGFTMGNWAGVIGPKGLPDQVVKRWNEVIKKVMSEQSFLKSLENVGGAPSYLGPDAFMKVMETTYKTAEYYADKMGLKRLTK